MLGLGLGVWLRFWIGLGLRLGLGDDFDVLDFHGMIVLYKFQGIDAVLAAGVKSGLVHGAVSVGAVACSHS